MKIRRRVKDGNTYKEVIEEATLVEKRAKSIFVKLSNGDVIKRKLKDIVEEKKRGDKNEVI